MCCDLFSTKIEICYEMAAAADDADPFSAHRVQRNDQSGTAAVERSM
jgi:hypothetical protein